MKTVIVSYEYSVDGFVDVARRTSDSTRATVLVSSGSSSLALMGYRDRFLALRNLLNLLLADWE